MAEYRCTNCGYVTDDADEAPEECPVCKHKDVFEKIKD